jgi:transposase
MRTLSLDLRERILSAYDKKEGTREQIAARFRVSLGMVKKLLQQRRRTGSIAPRHHLAGRKPTILAGHRSQFRVLLQRKNDLTLNELRAASGLNCSLQAINVVLGKMGLTYKKRQSAPANGASGPGPRPRKVGSSAKEPPIWASAAPGARDSAAAQRAIGRLSP